VLQTREQLLAKVCCKKANNCWPRSLLQLDSRTVMVTTVLLVTLASDCSTILQHAAVRLLLSCNSMLQAAHSWLVGFTLITASCKTALCAYLIILFRFCCCCCSSAVCRRNVQISPASQHSCTSHLPSSCHTHWLCCFCFCCCTLCRS
jgi:hypothetical protein